MVAVTIDVDRLEQLAAELSLLCREFETLGERLEYREEAVGHGEISERLRDLATNWTNARNGLRERLEELGTLASDAGRFYRQREGALAQAFDRAGHGGSFR